MRAIEIESWVLRVAEQAEKMQHVEDALVELKSTWPKPAAAARQIAAHANAARGAHILWVVGIDEEKGVCGAEPTELADWFAAVRSQFNQIYPDVHDLNVRIGDQTVVALLFQTERAPYLVKNPTFGNAGGGPVEWEVPWREGRKTRSATREDLIRMLAPLTTLPEIECLDCTLAVRDERHPDGNTSRRWFLHGSLYVVPSASETIVFPFHRCSIAAVVDNAFSVDTWSNIRLSPPRRFSVRAGVESSSTDSLTVEASSHEVIVAGPGRVNFVASTIDQRMPEPADSTVSITLKLNAIGALVPSLATFALRPVKAEGDMVAKWELERDAA